MGHRYLAGLGAGLSIAFAVAILLLTSASPGPVSPSGYAPGLAPAASPKCETAEHLPTPICHIYIIFLENEPYYLVMNTSYEGHHLATKYSIAADYYSVEHYSFPNYLAATAGFVTNYQQVMARANIVNLLQNHSPALSWDAFMQGMPTPCNQSPSPTYRTAHNPFVWYADIWDNQSYCRAHDIKFYAWSVDSSKGHLPVYGFIAPNVTNDCWKTGLQQCDAWLSVWLQRQIDTPAVFNNSVFFVTYDESKVNDTQSANGTANGGGHIFTAAVSPYSCRGYASKKPYDHYDLLTTTEWLLGLGRLGSEDNWSLNPPMRDLFCFNNTSQQSGSPALGPAVPSGTTLPTTNPAPAAVPQKRSPP
jgi:hypothetical protein